jgi:hypothetical protein
MVPAQEKQIFTLNLRSTELQCFCTCSDDGGGGGVELPVQVSKVVNVLN